MRKWYWPDIFRIRNILSHSNLSDITMEKMTVNSIFWLMWNNFLHWMLPVFIKKMLDWDVLEIAKSSTQDKENSEYNREPCSHINQCCYYHILSCGYCPTWYGVETLNQWSLADFQHVIDRQNTLSWPVRQE